MSRTRKLINRMIGNTPEDVMKDLNKVFSMEVEEELKEYLILSSKIHHGLTKKECKLLAYELAEKNKLKVPNSWKVNKIAGENWLKEFCKR
ncbi:hypothetical protein ILUMI_14176 [Ignelater luminosus]|uniref:Uncharacterized protein n=1 Tax=Ignelater luminosus TaxID=2038154 RepID=A0A8K0CX29_IGNLU|nr:hypothetical protein ILUMI_14176 [Ignelater luminosus]